MHWVLREKYVIGNVFLSDAPRIDALFCLRARTCCFAFPKDLEKHCSRTLHISRRFSAPRFACRASEYTWSTYTYFKHFQRTCNDSSACSLTHARERRVIQRMSFKGFRNRCAFPPKGSHLLLRVSKGLRTTIFSDASHFASLFLHQGSHAEQANIHGL